MDKLSFYDMKTKTKFETDQYTIETRGGLRGTKQFAVAIAPSGTAAWRVIKKTVVEAKQ